MTDSIRVMCVDDEEHILRTLERFCRNEGISMLRANSVAEALSLLEHESVAIIISDYQMPQTNGIEFLAEVRRRWQHSTRIILSGFVELPEIHHALEQGIIHAYLGKPWKRDELKALLNDAMLQARCANTEGGR